MSDAFTPDFPGVGSGGELGGKSKTRFEQWLDRVQEITDAATPGPWEAWGKREGGVWIETDYDEVLHHDRRGTGHLSEDYSWMLPADAEFIAHARTALPAAVAALQAVLDLHRQAAYQRNVPRMFRRTHEDHLPYRSCDGCGEEWPCPTITAIADAIKEWVPLARAALTAAVGDDDE